MICSNCGTQLDDNSKFCTKCGKPVSTDNVNTTTMGQNANVTGQQPSGVMGTPVPAPVRKKPSLKLLGIIGAVAVALVVLIVVLVMKGKTVNLNKYLIVSYEGYNTYGHATVTFDTEKFNKDFGDKIKFRKKESGLGLISAEEMFWMYIDGDLDKSSELSNGDEIVYSWDIDEEEIEKMFNLKIKYSDKTFTVSGLEELDSFDPFEDLTVEFSGVSPQGKATIVNNSSNEYVNNMHFSIDKDYDLSNGDVITVTANYGYYSDVVEACAEDFGAIPTELSKSFTVEGLGYYATEISQIPEDVLEQMKDQTEDELTAATAGKSDEQLNSAEYIGAYLLSPKEGVYSWNENTLYLIYEVKVTDTIADKNMSSDITYYYYTAFNNIIMHEDGTCEVDVFSYDTPYAQFYRDVRHGMETWEAKGYSYKGYETLKKLYDDCVGSKVNDYTYDTTFESDSFDSYVMRLEDIPDDVIEQLKDKSEDFFVAYTASTWSEEQQFNSMDYLGSYLLVPKNTDGTQGGNILYLVYRINGSDQLKEGITGDYSYYCYMAFHDITIAYDGTCRVDMYDFDIPNNKYRRDVYFGSRSWDYRTFSYVGYETLDELYNSCVTTNVNNYTYESDMTESVESGDAENADGDENVENTDTLDES